MTIVPDYIEPVEGWRLWFVDDRFRLRSVTFDISWSPGEPLEAVCRRRRRSWRPPWRALPAEHGAPVASCRCGIYGAKDPAVLHQYVAFALPRWAVALVVGRVSLWGTVVEGELGWRAAAGYPALLYVPTERASLRYMPAARVPAARIARGLARYGVPIELTDSISAPQPFEAVFR